MSLNRTPGLLGTHTDLDRYVASYARVSLDEQKTGGSVASQHEENEEFGEEVGRRVTRRFQDIGISAYSGDSRPDYERLLEEITAGRVAVVIVWHVDRLTRDVGVGHAFMNLCRATGTRLFSQQRGGEYNFNRANGRADFINDIVNANKESGIKGERVSLARKRQAKNAQYGGGTRPYGWGVETGRYRSVCVNPKADIGERIYEERPILDMTQHRANERDEIRRWKTQLLSGVSLAYLLRDIAERGVPTGAETDGRETHRNGKTFTQHHWTAVTVKRVLTSPRVAGHSVYRGEIIKWKAYPPIISEQERQALITILDNPARKTSPGNTPKWLGSYIYECSTCGGGRHTVRNNGNGVPLYCCTTCDAGRQNAVLVDRYIEYVLIQKLSQPDLVKLLAPPKEVDVEALRDEVAVLRQQLDELALMFARRAITGSQLETGTAETTKRIREIEKTLNEAVSESPLAPFVANHEPAEKIWRQLPIGVKRELLKTLLTVRLMKAPDRRRGRRPKNAPPETLDLSTIIITPKTTAS
jgi:site-specific DNA recombinase